MDMNELIEKYNDLHGFDESKRIAMKAFALDVIDWWRKTR